MQGTILEPSNIVLILIKRKTLRGSYYNNPHPADGIIEAHAGHISYRRCLRQVAEPLECQILVLSIHQADSGAFYFNITQFKIGSFNIKARLCDTSLSSVVQLIGNISHVY